MADRNDILVQCTRCRNKHQQSERIALPSELGHSRVCPRCGCKSYYDMTPQVAWCWASGLIEMGSEEQVPEGGIIIARGPKAFLKGELLAAARHGWERDQLLVPGVPEAANQREAAEALDKFLAWRGKSNGRRGSNGVIYSQPGKPMGSTT